MNSTITTSFLTTFLIVLLFQLCHADCIVTSSSDDGDGSLRSCINNSGESETITFSSDLVCDDIFIVINSTLELKNRQHLDASGTCRPKIYCSSPNFPGLKLSNNNIIDNISTENCSIGILFTGNRSTAKNSRSVGNSATGITFSSSSSNCSVQGCRVNRNGTNGIYDEGTSNMISVSVIGLTDQNEDHPNDTNGIYTIGTDTKILLNVITGNSDSCGILIGEAAIRPLVHNNIIGVKKDTFSGNIYGILVNASGCIITDNIIKTNRMHGIKLSGNDNLVEGNTLVNNSNTGIYVGGSGNLIKGNTIKENKGVTQVFIANSGNTLEQNNIYVDGENQELVRFSDATVVKTSRATLFVDSVSEDATDPSKFRVVISAINLRQSQDYRVEFFASPSKMGGGIPVDETFSAKSNASKKIEGAVFLINKTAVKEEFINFTLTELRSKSATSRYSTTKPLSFIPLPSGSSLEAKPRGLKQIKVTLSNIKKALSRTDLIEKLTSWEVQCQIQTNPPESFDAWFTCKELSSFRTMTTFFRADPQTSMMFRVRAIFQDGVSTWVQLPSAIQPFSEQSSVSSS